MTPIATDRKLCAVMFTDIAGYTSITHLDEDAALRSISTHRRCLEKHTALHHGQVVQFYGDGSLSIYNSVIDAVRCAIAMQKCYRKENLPVRIGIHHGDVIFKEETVLGDSVNIASRIQAEGAAGSVLFSQKVFREIQNHSDIRVAPLGMHKLRNISEPMALYAVANPGVVIPQRHKESKSRRYLALAIPVLVLALAFGFVRLMSSAKPSETTTLRIERIAIPEFQDLTDQPGYGIVSKMAAHWITTELIETVGASVVSYQSAVENQPETLQAGGIQTFGARTGAVNVVQGAYYLTGANQDTLEFRATIRNLRTGELLNVVLAQPRCHASTPMECMRELASSLAGYWQSRNDQILRVPDYHAYRLYLQAREAWFADDALADSLLRACIATDPDFIDAWFLLIDTYYNRRDFEGVARTIEEIKQRFTTLTPRQQNFLSYHEADNAGRNIEAFQHFYREYRLDPKDLFVNTTGMVLAGEHLNSPEMILQFFRQIPSDSLDLAQCAYCEERWSFAIHAYQSLGKWKQARKLADELKVHVRRFQNFQRLVEFYVAIGDTISTREVLERSEDHLAPLYVTYLHFIAGRQAHLAGDLPLRNLYAAEAARRSGDSTRMYARCLYLMDDLHESLRIYRHALSRDSSDMRIYGEMGVIHARLGDHAESEDMIRMLDRMRGPFDYGNATYMQARIAAHLGDRGRALTLLRQSLEEGQKFLTSLTYDQDPDLQILRTDPAFQSLLVRT